MKFKKVFKKILLGLLFLILIFLGYLFIGEAPRAEKITWGVNFSQKHAKDLGLDWKETFLALLDDLKVRNFKIAAHWDLIEPEDDQFYFDDLDWQINEAEKRGAKVFLVIGMKTTRWPECHIPDWAKNLTKEEQQKEILEMIEKIVLRYRDHWACPHTKQTTTPKVGGEGEDAFDAFFNKDSSCYGVGAWQIENEPFFPFGICPWVDKKFVKTEVNLVKSLDPERPIIMADSGEGSFWIDSARFGDIPSTTMYRKVYFRQIKMYVEYPFPPVFYWRKAKIIKFFFGKKVIVGELQAEPFGPVLLYDLPLSEQEKTMNLERFKKNIGFATKTGFDTFYLWGSEWWYWMKTRQNRPEIWEEAKKLFQ